MSFLWDWRALLCEPRLDACSGCCVAAAIFPGPCSGLFPAPIIAWSGNMLNSSIDQYSQASRKVTVTQRCIGIDGKAHLPTALHPGLPKPHSPSIHDPSKRWVCHHLPRQQQQPWPNWISLFLSPSIVERVPLSPACAHHGRQVNEHCEVWKTDTKNCTFSQGED